jgi:hypothetical protein
MALNRYFNPTAYEGELYAPPVEFIGAALQQLQGQYDTNYAAALQLKDTYLDALPKDRGRANEIQNDISTQVDNLVAKYSGDYSQATKDLYALQMDVKRKLRPGSEGHAIVHNYTAYNTATQRERERLSKGEITQAQYHALVTNIESTYQGAKLDPLTSTYQLLQPPPLANYVDGHARMDAEVTKLKPRTTTTTERVLDPSTGEIIYREVTKDQIDPTEAAGVAMTTLMQDHEFVSYITQLAQLQGTSPDTIVNDMISDYVKHELPARTGVFKDQTKLTSKENPVARDQRLYQRQMNLENLRQRNKMAFEDYKNRAEGTADGGTIDVLTTANTNFSPFKKLEYGGYNWLGQRKAIPSVSSKLVSDDPDINRPLLETIKKNNPNMSDKDVWNLYDQNVEGGRFGSELYYYKYQTTAAQKEDAERIIPQIINGSRPIYEINTKTGQISEVTSADGRRAAASSMVEFKQGTSTITKIKGRALGKTSPASGQLPFGTILDPMDGQGKVYISPESDVNFNNFNFGEDGTGERSLRKAAFGYAENPNQEVGVPFGMNVEGENVPMLWGKTYEWDAESQRAIPKVNYYPPIQKGSGYVPDYENPYTVKDAYGNDVPIDPFYLEQQLIPAQERYRVSPKRPRSATKDYNNPLED